MARILIEAPTRAKYPSVKAVLEVAGERFTLARADLIDEDYGPALEAFRAKFREIARAIPAEYEDRV
jgi:hypothetical protein